MKIEQYNRLLDSGIIIEDMATTFINGENNIQKGVKILANTILEDCDISEGCVIGPNSYLYKIKLGSNSVVKFSYLEDTVIGKSCSIGPFSHLRSKSKISDDVSIGNYVEIKNSLVGEGTKINHHAYIGDSDIGLRVNIGAGSITCNYDGSKKHRTFIGNDVFIGSGTMLIAPLRLGNNSKTGAGSVVTQNVEDNITVVGNPAKILDNA